MARNPLPPLLRLRSLARDAALRDLAATLRAEADAAQAVAVLEVAIARETDAAAALTGDDAVVEAFGRWLRSAHQHLAAATAVREDASAEVDLARAVLAAARSAARAAEELLDAQDAAARAHAARGDQRTLDDLAGQQRKE